MEFSIKQTSCRCWNTTLNLGWTLDSVITTGRAFSETTVDVSTSIAPIEDVIYGDGNEITNAQIKDGSKSGSSLVTLTAAKQNLRLALQSSVESLEEGDTGTSVARLLVNGVSGVITNTDLSNRISSSNL